MMIETDPLFPSVRPRTLDLALRRIADGNADVVHPDARFPALSRVDAIRPGAGGWLAAIVLILAAIHVSKDNAASLPLAPQPSEYASI